MVLNVYTLWYLMCTHYGTECVHIMVLNVYTFINEMCNHFHVRMVVAGSRIVDKREIPEDEEEKMERWKVGESCLAKWSEDNVWYKVEIKECLPKRIYLVRSEVNTILVDFYNSL